MSAVFSFKYKGNNKSSEGLCGSNNYHYSLCHAIWLDSKLALSRADLANSAQILRLTGQDD